LQTQVVLTNSSNDQGGWNGLVVGIVLYIMLSAVEKLFSL